MSKRNTALALRAVNELKDRHCKVNLSNVANLALEIFFDKYFETSMGVFEKRFFDRKKYLKDLIQSGNQDSLDNSLKEYVKKIKKSPVKVHQKDAE